MVAGAVKAATAQLDRHTKDCVLVRTKQWCMVLCCASKTAPGPLLCLADAEVPQWSFSGRQQADAGNQGVTSIPKSIAYAARP
jgi:hypothetical protein